MCTVGAKYAILDAFTNLTVEFLPMICNDFQI